jgi:hypothetical protein
MTAASSRAKLIAVILTAFGTFLCLPCYPWGGMTTEAISNAAVSTLTGEIGSFIKRSSSYFREGIAADPETLKRYAGFSSFDAAGYAAERLDGQINLLRDLFPSERSPYMAYRLGILARLIMDLNSPFAVETAPGELRERFMRDVEAHRAELRYAPHQPRIMMDPMREIRAAIERSAGWTEPVKAQYRSGRGYNSIVQGAAAKFYNEAVVSLSDVLYTVGSGAGGKAGAEARYEFYRSACDYYLRRGMKQDAIAAYRKAARYASAMPVGELGSLEEMAGRYEYILDLAAIEERLRGEGVAIPVPASTAMRGPFLSELSRLAKGYTESGQKNKARAVLLVCLREGYLPDWTLQNMGKLYGLDRLENLDVQENAWKVYREANRLEEAAAKQYAEGRLSATCDAYGRAAALYAVIPDSVKDVKRESRGRIEQITGRLGAIPPSAFFSEELFQGAVDSLARGELDEAVRSFQVSERWGVDLRAAAGAKAEVEALRLFTKGKALYDSREYDRGVRYFRRLVEQHPASRLAIPAKQMIAMHEKMRELAAGRHLILLKTAYEASFVGDWRSVYGLCDEILGEDAGDDVRDRAQLLIAVAWYESNQRGYQKIDRIFRDLLKHQVLDVDEGKLVLKKRIDFYFGLKDPFPEMEFSEMKDSLLEKLGLKGRGPAAADARDEADDAITRAKEEIEAAEDTIGRAKDAKKDLMRNAQSILDKAIELLEDARDFFDREEYADAKDRAEEAYTKAVKAREEAERILGVTEDLKGEATRELDEAKSTVDEADDAYREAEEIAEKYDRERDREFERLKTDYEELKDLLRDAEGLFEDGDYEATKEKAAEIIDKAREVKKDAEEIKDEMEKAQEEAEKAQEEGGKPPDELEGARRDGVSPAVPPMPVKG